MSSPLYVSGKTSPTKRIANDFYQTPPIVVKETLKAFFKDYDDKFPEIFDYGCGKYVWGNEIRSYLPNSVITGIDINFHPDLNSYNYVLTQSIESFLDRSDQMFDLIIGNPPYKNLDKIMPRLFERLNNGGAMAFLLPLQYLQGQKRYEIFAPFLEKIYVYVDRIKWYGKSPHGQHAFFVYSTFDYRARSAYPMSFLKW